MLLAFCFLAFAAKTKDQIIEMDSHRFRMAVFHRDMLTIWVSLFSSPELEGHVEANEAFEEAYKLGKGFLKFAYLDSVKNVKVPRRLGLKDLPAFCVFHANGESCTPANLTGRQLINYAGLYYPDFTKVAQTSWISDFNEPSAILFSEKKQPPFIWSAISSFFRKHQIKIGFSNDKDFAATLDVKEFPSIVFINQTHRILYDGENKFNPMKDAIKKFMQKKLQKIPKGLRVYPLKDFEEHSKGEEMICIIDALSDDSSAVEALRKKHRSAFLQFFFGKEDLPHPAFESGKVYAYKPTTGQFTSFGSIEDLDKKIQDILSGDVAWTSSEL